MTIAMSMIMGFHHRSLAFYSNEQNLMITSDGFIDFMIESESLFPFPFKSLLTNLSVSAHPKSSDLTISMEIITFFLDLCEKNKKYDLFSGKFEEKTLIVIEQAIAHLKDFIEKSEDIRKEILEKHLVTINRIENCYARLKPNKHCSLRKVVETDP